MVQIFLNIEKKTFRNSEILFFNQENKLLIQVVNIKFMKYLNDQLLLPQDLLPFKVLYESISQNMINQVSNLPIRIRVLEKYKKCTILIISTENYI